MLGIKRKDSAVEFPFPLTPTLIGVPKLFIGGEESLGRLSPQPAVNNFAAHQIRLGYKWQFEACCALVTPGWEDEYPDRKGLTFWERPSLPARRLGSKRILWMSRPELSAIRASRSQGQRAHAQQLTQLQ